MPGPGAPPAPPMDPAKPSEPDPGLPPTLDPPKPPEPDPGLPPTLDPPKPPEPDPGLPPLFAPKLPPAPVDGAPASGSTNGVLGPHALDSNVTINTPKNGFPIELRTMSISFFVDSPLCTSTGSWDDHPGQRVTDCLSFSQSTQDGTGRAVKLDRARPNLVVQPSRCAVSRGTRRASTSTATPFGACGARLRPNEHDVTWPVVASSAPVNSSRRGAAG
jgi:hypothetical protein